MLLLAAWPQSWWWGLLLAAYMDLEKSFYCPFKVNVYFGKMGTNLYLSCYIKSQVQIPELNGPLFSAFFLFQCCCGPFCCYPSKVFLAYRALLLFRYWDCSNVVRQSRTLPQLQGINLIVLKRVIVVYTFVSDWSRSAHVTKLWPMRYRRNTTGASGEDFAPW